MNHIYKPADCCDVETRTFILDVFIHKLLMQTENNGLQRLIRLLNIRKSNMCNCAAFSFYSFFFIIRVLCILNVVNEAQ